MGRCLVFVLRFVAAQLALYGVVGVASITQEWCSAVEKKEIADGIPTVGSLALAPSYLAAIRSSRPR